MSSTATVSPSTTTLTTAERATYSEKVTIGIPKKGAIAKIDIYFLTDSTGSMTSIIDAVKKGASDILGQLRDKAQNIGADLHFGVGNYRDLDFPVADRFNHQKSLTSNTDEVQAAITSWTTAGGNTTAEGQLYGLDQLAESPNGSIGWRSDAKRIVVWFGDAPGHDPICKAISGLSYDITEQSVTTKLEKQEIFVLVISTPSGSSGPGLDVDPVPNSSGGDYESKCGAVGGTAGQGSRIASATGGTYADGISPQTIVQTIIKLGGAEVERISNVNLIANKKIAPFVTSISPKDGHGPFSAGKKQELDFDVSFAGVSTGGSSASKVKPVTVKGSLDVKADGLVVGRQTVEIAVPDLSGKYKIQCVKSEMLLQIENPAWKGDGGNVSQGADKNAKYQQWELIPVAGGGYRIKNMDPAKDRFLEVAGQSSENMAEILTRSNPDGKHKQWQLIPVGADEYGIIYKIQNLHSGKVLDVKGGSKDEGARIYQYGYWGDHPVWQKAHQHHWRLLAV